MKTAIVTIAAFERSYFLHLAGLKDSTDEFLVGLSP